jgi:peptidoglycan-associated lipoprotein
MKRIFLSIASTVALSLAVISCGSNVKLDDVPVENRTATTVGNQGNTGGVSARGVTPVEIAGSNSPAVGPAGVTKVIYFDYDSFAIKPEFQGAVEAHARYLAANKARKLAVEGNTDERGGREYNLALGQKRAEAVRRALGLLGVTDAQVEAVSFGKEKPADTGSDEAAFAKNRRAEMNYR